MDNELLERIRILEDNMMTETTMRKGLSRRLKNMGAATEELRDYINVKLPTLQHTIGFMQGLLEEHEEEIDKLIDKLTKSNA